MRDPDATRSRLERAAIDLFVRQGIAETTTRQIAGAAGVAEGTIYRHHESKEALARSILAGIANRLVDALEAAAGSAPDTRGRTHAIVATYLRMADEDWPLFTFHLLYQHALGPSGAGLATRSPVDVVRRVIAEGMERGEVPRRDLELVVGMALGVVLQTATQKVYGLLRGDLSPHADLLASAVWSVLSLR